MTARAPAAAALVVLGTALAVALAVTTPWQPLTGAPPVPADPSLDFSAAERRREEGFSALVRPVSYARLAAGLLVASALALTPLGARLVQAAARPLGGGRWARLVAGTVAVSLVLLAVRLPFSARNETVLRRYGLSTQTWGTWALDVLRGLAVDLVLTVLVLAVVLALVRRFPRGWWAPVGAAGALLVVLGSYAYPLVVEPVFNRFTPLPAGPLRDDLLALAEREGVELGDVLVADASRRTTALNAYVSGFGATKRLVLHDTLLEGAPADEVRLVAAHELAHAAEHDVRDGTLLGALGAATAACGAYLLLTWAPLLRRAGVDSVADPRAVPLLLFVVTAATLVTSPVQSLVSRRVEARADVVALDATRDPAAAVRLERTLALRNLNDLDPPRLAYLWFASHPTPPERIALARAWARREGVPVPPPAVP